jgi:hypothetical protein
MPHIKPRLRAELSRIPPAEAREQASIMAVALAQPHRRGNSDQKAGEPLCEACRRLRLRDELYRAGCDYGVVSRNAKIAMGMRDGVAEGRGSVDDALQVARDRVAVQRYRDAIRVLRGVSRYAYGVLEIYCFEERHVALWGDAYLAQGLDALANHWGMIDRGIAEGKPIWRTGTGWSEFRLPT